MPKKQFHRICKALRNHNVLVLYGENADAICGMHHVEAITLNENTILFRKNPSRAAVFEELIHMWQYSSGKCDGSTISRIICEIEAKEKLLRCAKAYKLTKKDIIITKNLLANDYNDLKTYYEGGNRDDSN